MKSKKLIYTTLMGLFLIAYSARGAGPSVTISGLNDVTGWGPGYQIYGQTIHPMADATRGDYPLQTVILAYCWGYPNDDYSYYTELGATPYASNPTDSEGNPLLLNQESPLFLYAQAWDTEGARSTYWIGVYVISSYSKASINKMSRWASMQDMSFKNDSAILTFVSRKALRTAE